MLQTLLLANYDFFDAYPIIGFLIFIFIFFLLINGLHKFLYGNTHEAFCLAKEKVKERLQSIEPISLDLYLQQTKLPIEHYANAKKLLKNLAIGLHIADPERLTFKEPFKHYFNVSVSQLPLNEKQLKYFNKYFNSGYIEVYTDHFLKILKTFYGSKNWHKLWIDNTKIPQTEDELIDFVLEMTPEEFLCYFVPLAHSVLHDECK